MREETRKQQLVRECTETVKEIRYYSTYPYGTWLGRLISKLIIRRFKFKLNRKEKELRIVLKAEMEESRRILSIKEGENKKPTNQKITF